MGGALDVCAEQVVWIALVVADLAHDPLGSIRLSAVAEV
jgi:hypothetical protein